MDLFYTIFEYIYVIIGVVLLFGAAVFVHEFGHFWAARKCGMKVEEFAIGFGPKIKSWKKNGIEYSIRWIPAGGFVRLPQMVTSEALEGASEEPCPPAAPWKRIVTAFAGPFMNLIFGFVLAVILYFVGLPMLVNPPIIGPLEEDSAEYKMGIRMDDEIIYVNNEKVRSWEDVYNKCILLQTNVVNIVTKRGDSFFTNNLTLAPKGYLEEMGIQWKLPNLEPKGYVSALSVIKDGPGERAGLKDGDAIVSFNGQLVLGTQQLVDMVRQNPGKECQMVVLRSLPGSKDRRDKEEITLTITPDDMQGVGRIAVSLGAEQTVYQVVKPGPKPWEKVWDVIDKTYLTIAALCNSSKTGVGAKDLSGPPGILAMLAAYVKTDYRLALDFMILLNINLAILNLLPIPVLDGGHILMACFEKITGRPISLRFLEYVNTAFALLLIGFMLYVSFNDILRMKTFARIYTQDSQVEEIVPQTEIEK